MAGEGIGIVLRAGVIIGSIIRLMRRVKVNEARSMSIDLMYQESIPVWELALTENSNTVVTAQSASLEAALSEVMLKVGV